MQVLLCVGDDFLRRGLKFAVILELRRGVLNRAKSSIVCNASVTNFRVIPDFPAVFGYPNVKQALILVIQEIIISQENYNSKRLQTSELRFWGFSLPLNLDERSRNVVKLIRFATKKSIPIFCMKKIFTIRTTEDVYGKAKL